MSSGVTIARMPEYGQIRGNGTATQPQGFHLALVVNFVLGALLTLGIGNYAPSLIVFMTRCGSA